MNKVVEFLNANPVQYLATVGRDGKAKCRPFMFAGELDGKLWFCTNNTKDVYKDLHLRVLLHILVDVLGVVGAEPEPAVHFAGEHEGAALRLPIGTDRSQILDGICGKELNDFLHGSLSFSRLRFAGESI